MQVLPAEAPRIHNPPTAQQWEPILIDQPAFPFEARPAPGPYRPDTICDGWATPHIVVRLASVRGDAHRHSGAHRQDHAAAVVHPRTGAVLFAVMDGVSNASHAHVGAEIAGHTALATLWDMLDQGDPINWQTVLARTADALVKHHRYGVHRHESASDVERRLGTTIVTGIVRQTQDGPIATMVRAGDSGAWVLRRSHYARLFDGEHIVDPTIDTTVRPLPRLPDRVEVVERALPLDSALLVATDGIGDALGDGTGLVGQLLARALERPPPMLAVAHVIGFSRETFDDDRTLLAIWPRGDAAQAGR
jgi:serine/threonine protein phosphatase PrpC